MLGFGEDLGNGLERLESSGGVGRLNDGSKDELVDLVLGLPLAPVLSSRHRSHCDFMDQFVMSTVLGSSSLVIGDRGVPGAFMICSMTAFS